MKLTKKNVLCLPKIKKWKAGFFCDLRKDFVLDQRVLRRDLLRVKGRVKSLLGFDTRSVERRNKFCLDFTLGMFYLPSIVRQKTVYISSNFVKVNFQPVYQEGVV